MCAHLSPCCPSTHCPGRAANASPAPDHQGPHAEKSGWRRRGGASVRRPPDAGIRPELPVPAPAAARLGPARGGGASRPVPGSARCSSCTVGNGVRVAVIQWALGGGASTPHAGFCGLLFVPSPAIVTGGGGGIGAGLERDTDYRQKNEITEEQRLKTKSPEMERPEIPEPEDKEQTEKGQR